MWRNLTARFVSSLVLSSAVLAAPLAASAQEQPQQVKTAPEVQRSTIDIVIALDTSNSMDGLINAARQKLWDIVNDLATAKPTPILRVGVVSFGNDGYNNEGWTRIDIPLTDDLDSVHQKLMGLTTNGGTEYVGSAIKTSLDNMQWSQDKNTLKMIFVAGNESADQDPKHRALDLAARAIQRDIIVNTIFCGNEGSDAVSWRDVAQRADGQYAAIAADGGAVVVNTPYDQRLNELSGQLNSTYIAYGREGEAAMVRQQAADKSALQMGGGVAAGRAAAKSSALYRNSNWDLVDAEADGRDVKDIPTEQLPAEMQKMTPAQRQAHVDKMKQRREELQKEIQTLNKKREEYVRKEMAKNGKEDAFDVAVKKAVRKQASAKNIAF